MSFSTKTSPTHPSQRYSQSLAYVLLLGSHVRQLDNLVAQNAIWLIESKITIRKLADHGMTVFTERFSA